MWRQSREPEMGSLGCGMHMRNGQLRNIALVGSFHRKRHHQTSPVGLPLELEVTWSEVPLEMLSGTSTSITVYERTRSLVICPIPTILFSWGRLQWLYFLQKFVVFGYVVRVIVFNATFNNIWIISWRSVVLVEKTGWPEENQRPVASHWQTL